MLRRQVAGRSAGEWQVPGLGIIVPPVGTPLLGAWGENGGCLGAGARARGLQGRVSKVLEVVF